MTRTPVYIAAPYRGDPERNTSRAEALATLALRMGFTPICVHSSILRGVYGDDDDPAQRKLGVEASRDLAVLVAQSLGDLWVLQCDDSSLSEGTRGEVFHFTSVGSQGAIHMRRWIEWSKPFVRHGLEDLWNSLR